MIYEDGEFCPVVFLSLADDFFNVFELIEGSCSGLLVSLYFYCDFSSSTHFID